jgi:hypothetical protein
MSTPTATPRTDAVAYGRRRIDSLFVYTPTGEHVQADFARELETELSRLRAENDRLRFDRLTLEGVTEMWKQEKARAEEAEAALEFISEQGGTINQTESGEVSCNGRWCAQQARDALTVAGIPCKKREARK